MSMINELVKELRRAENPCSVVSVGYYRTLYARAADTIEELSAKLADANMERSTAYYNNGWVPCSERLPGVADEYEVTVDCNGKLFTTNSFYDAIESDWNTWKNHITAWRERLPEPYKGVEWMGRLTGTNNDYCFTVCGGERKHIREDCNIYKVCFERQIYERLKHYEDLEEAGRLVVLPEEFDKEKFIYSNCPSYILLEDHCHGDCKECWEAALESRK